jgi:predicted DsbA family dithiol-disulfide isomerase
VAVDITLFTDPACPFAFSAEPTRQRLRWLYGDQLRWRLNMIVLTLEPGEDAKLAEGAPGLQRKYGMPIDPAPYSRTFSSQPACRAVVAAREHAPGTEERLLRGLRVRAMLGGLLDDPALIAAAASDAGLDPDALAGWDADAALAADVAAARDPTPAARALDHKLGGPRSQRRYTAPSYEIGAISVPGFNPVEAYDIAIAAQLPDVVRRPPPASVEELLAWAGEPLATAEIVAVMERGEQSVRAALAKVARSIPAGADCYWAYGS